MYSLVSIVMLISMLLFVLYITELHILPLIDF